MNKAAAALFVAVFALPVAAQAVRSPDEVAREFYQWYFHELNASREPQNQRAKINASVSKRLAKWYISPAYSEWGADYFIDAQDYESKWENTLTATKATINGSRATLKVKFPAIKGSGFGSKTLSLQMVKEGNAWKIDRVNNHVVPGR
jgi:hypothetical protein